MWTKCPACGFGPVNDADPSCSACGASLAELKAQRMAATRAEIERLQEGAFRLEPLDECEADEE